MFAQLFIFVVGVFSLVVGFLEGNYLWAFCGLVMTLSGINLLYKLKTGKNIWQKSNT